MKCMFCGTDMVLEDKDYNFKGNYDNYWLCPNCYNSCVEEVRFSKTVSIIWDIDSHIDTSSF